MLTDANFNITRKTQSIPGLQAESEDTYCVTRRNDSVDVKFISRQFGETISEEKSITLLSFEETRDLILYLSENGVGAGSWIDILDDYCYSKTH